MSKTALFKKLLASIKHPDDVAKLSDEGKKAYSKALDAIYGPKEERIKKMGFSPATEIIGANTDYKYTTSPALIKYLDRVNKKGEDIYIKNLDDALNIRDVNYFGKLADEPYKTRVSGTKFIDSIENLAKASERPLYDPEVNAYKVLNDSTITRSKNAFFDPRFENMKNKLAAGVAVPISTDMSPLPFLEKGIKKYDEFKDKVTSKLAEQLDLSKSKDTKENIKDVLDFTLDPLDNSPFGLLAEFLRKKRD